MAVKKKPRKLTPKQEKFIAYYSGNGTDAARKAGYSGDDNSLGVIAYDNLRNPKIRGAIKKRHQADIEPLVATRTTMQKFWSKVMSDSQTTMQNRLKASELLGKSEAVFTDNLNTKAEVKTEVRVVNIEEIETSVKKFDDDY